jgi:ubiquinone/menaquinone biosynthesis C-methylase UbiE
VTSDLFTRVPAALPDILRGAERGDWRLRTACLSALGARARARSSLIGALDIVVRHIPGLGAAWAGTGYQGRYVRGPIGNGLVDRSWPVRVAAALALGDCRSADSGPALHRLLAGPYRAERIAAASAIVSCGGTVEGGPSLLSGALPAPTSIGDAHLSCDVLTALAGAHGGVLLNWRQVPGQDQPAGADPAAWGPFLAGVQLEESAPDIHAEMDRYINDGDAEYLLTKPFSRINHVQNPRLLHAFLVACEHLRLGADARVLDLGGGPAWVSELLAKLGYRPVTLDVSLPLLAIGRRRFAREGLAPWVAAADMRRLPIADGSVQGVIVIDALHHVPDVPAVFAEAFRVLDDGGAFVLAEPGEGHAESSRARSEMREYGVQEREIHLLEMFEYARRAGFADVRAVPHYEPGIAMTREQLDAAMTSPSDAWMVLNEDRPGYLAPYVIQSMFNHPILVARKGGQVADSRTPAALRADLAFKLQRDAARVTGTVTARNLGNTIWMPGSERGHVRLGIQLLTADLKLIALDYARAAFASRVAPDESVEIVVDVTLPDATTPYVLKLDMVDEGICWFEERGSNPVFAPVART